MLGESIGDSLRREHFVTYALLRAELSPRKIADIIGVSRETISVRKTGRTKHPLVDVQEAESVAEGLFAQGMSGEKLFVALIGKAWKRFPAGSRTFPNGDPDLDVFKPDGETLDIK